MTELIRLAKVRAGKGPGRKSMEWTISGWQLGSEKSWAANVIEPLRICTEAKHSVFMLKPVARWVKYLQPLGLSFTGVRIEGCFIFYFVSLPVKVAWHIVHTKVDVKHQYLIFTFPNTSRWHQLPPQRTGFQDPIIYTPLHQQRTSDF